MTDERKQQLYQNYQSVTARIEAARRRRYAKTGVDTPVTLLGASKTMEAEDIAYLMTDCGLRVAGENRAQEFAAKYDAVHAAGGAYDFIGHLQTNKVKYLIGKTHLIQSLDRMELADELQKRAARAGWVCDCLIEVNIGSELSKSGFSPEEAEAACAALRGYENLRVRGLMAMLPLSDDAALLSGLCQKMRALFETLREHDEAIAYLSMGMSGDWRLCVEHGSNMIRLGTSLFGPRRHPVPTG